MMSSVSMVTLGTSFAAGVISFLPPCVLPLVPGYVSYIGGRSLTASSDVSTPLSGLPLSVLFVLGFSIFVGFGASASVVGQLLLAYRYEMNLVAGSVIILILAMVSILGTLPPGDDVGDQGSARYSPTRGAIHHSVALAFIQETAVLDHAGVARFVATEGAS